MIKDLETMTEPYPPDRSGGPTNGVGYTSPQKDEKKIAFSIDIARQSIRQPGFQRRKLNSGVAIYRLRRIVRKIKFVEFQP